jgi:eukaryotic-like serine/threonine-protein kinase
VAAPFGKYEILAPLGAGGMGEVFLARERGPSGFERVVALKRLLPHMAKDAEFVRLFTREALLAAQLAHSHIVPVYEFGEINGYLYLAMEYVHGENLGTLTAAARSSGRPLEIALGAHICVQVAAALEYMHQKKDLAGKAMALVHRDVSPQNVLISFSGEVKLGDFGVAHVATSSSLADIRGKVAYMSPEQAMGRRVDSRSDLYSLGAVFFELVCGRPPFQGGSNLEMLERVRKGGAPRAREIDPRIPDTVDELLARALADDPGDRFQDARSMRLAFADIAEMGGLAAAAPVVLADRMRDLFPTRAISPTPQVEATLSADPSPPPRTTEAAQTELAKPTRTIAKVRSRRGWVVAAAVLLAGAAIGGVKWVRSTPVATELPAPAPARPLVTPPPSPAKEVAVQAPPPAPVPAADPTPVRHTSGPGRLSITASMPCDVSIDGKSRGRTPIADLTLAAGRHQVRCEGAGFAIAAERTVKMAAGSRTPLNFEFSRINVSDLTPWAQVFIDGKKVDRTPLSARVPAGTHKVKLVAADGREVVKMIDAAANRPVFIDRW